MTKIMKVLLVTLTAADADADEQRERRDLERVEGVVLEPAAQRGARRAAAPPLVPHLRADGLEERGGPQGEGDVVPGAGGRCRGDVGQM